MYRVVFTTAIFVLSAVHAYPAGPDTWMFRPGYYTHRPDTGQRVTQYAPLPMVAPLPDTRPFASGYQRVQVSQRGPGGTTETYNRVENWGNGRGGLDAEWERFHNAWRGSILSGGFRSGYGYPPPAYRAPGYWPGAWGPGRWWPRYGPPTSPGYPQGGPAYPGSGAGNTGMPPRGAPRP